MERDDGAWNHRSMEPSEDPFVLILVWFQGLMWEIEEIAALWDRRDEIYVSHVFLLCICTSRLNSLSHSHSQSENVMQVSNHASNLKAAEFRHRIAVHTRD
jgi:hypothetical protein